jgi:hypothetical protein
MSNIRNGETAGRDWKMKKAEMLLSFDAEAINTLHSLFRSTEKYESGVYGASGSGEIEFLLDQGFVELVRDGLIEPVRPFSTLGRQQYDSLLAAFPAEAA